MSRKIPGTPRPAPPSNPTGNPDYAYPSAEDQKIRDAAELLGADSIITLLDRIRVFVLGDLARTLALADRFSRERGLLTASELIAQSQLTLSVAWQGEAFSQFDKYAGFATGALNKSQDSVVKLTATMSNVAKVVLDTYKNLIVFIGNCAATLSTVLGKALIAAGTSVIPILNVVTSKEVLDTINSAFVTFWKDCMALLGGMITNVGSLIGSGLEFTAIETNFPKIPTVGASAEVIENPNRWRIKPGADNG